MFLRVVCGCYDVLILMLKSFCSGVLFLNVMESIFYCRNVSIFCAIILYNFSFGNHEEKGWFVGFFAGMDLLYGGGTNNFV
jgi:hypothetical protein